MTDIIVIMGPTAVGKTKLSILLAKKYNGEVINADSMQVYKGLDIGAAKIKEEEKEKITHHLLDICEVTDNYTVYHYQQDIRKKIEEIKQRGKKVIIVGGTGLYVKAALYNYQFTKNNEEDNQYPNLTNYELLEKLKQYDNKVDIHVNNRKRLIRYLNKYERGETLGTEKDTPLYNAKFIILNTNREILYERINKRVDEMFDEGLLQEIEKYKEKYPLSKALQTGIGYKEFIPYFTNTKTKEEVKEEIKKNTRHYAKRQNTFFLHQFKTAKWFDVDFENFNKTYEEVCNYIENN